MNPYDYQTNAVEQVREAFSAGLKRVVVQAPTGAGKSVILLMIAAACIAKGNRVLFVVHLSEIMHDFAERARQYGKFHVGVIAPGHNRSPYAELQIISVQSAVRGSSQLPPADVILFDEVQHLPAKTFRRILDLYSDAFVVGTSATPCRGDDKPLAMFEKLIVAATYSELIAQGKIVRAKVFQPAEHQGTNLALDPVEAYKRYGSAQKGFVFVRGIDTADETAKRYRDAGIPAEAVHSRCTRDVRTRAVRNLKSGATRLLVSDTILTEGVNVPEASVCVLASPCHFVGGYMQRTGRVLRSAPGKTHAIVIDLVGSSLKHGLPHIDRQFTLEGKTFDLTQLPPLTVCASCGLTQLGGRTSCEGCGFVFLRKPRKVPYIGNEELRAVFDFEDTPTENKLDFWLSVVDDAGLKSHSIDRCIAQYKELFGSEPPIEWRAGLPQEVKRREFERWKQQAEERGWKRGYAYARYLECFASPP